MRKFLNEIMYFSAKAKRQFTTSVAFRHLSRSYMYVPGDKLKMIDKIAIVTDSSPDIAVFDTEDGVDINNKDLARKNIFSVVKSGKLNANLRSTFCIRLNSLSFNSLIKRDLELVSDCLKASSYRSPSIITLPKVENNYDLNELYQQLKHFVDINTMKNPIKLDLMIESCQSINKLSELLDYFTKSKLTCFKLNNVVFGSDDYCASMGVSRSSSNFETLYARQHFVNVVKAYKLLPIDMVEIDIENMEGLYSNSKFGASIGFVGKQVIHPKQLPTVHRSFTPTDEKINWAKNLLTEYENQKSKNSGVFIFMGNMIDMPTILQAQYLLQTDSLIKKIHK